MIILLIDPRLCATSLDHYCRTAERRVDDQYDQNAKRIMGINTAPMMWYSWMVSVERYWSSGIDRVVSVEWYG